VRLTAYTIEGVSDVWDTWEGVEAWMLDGSKLIMRVRAGGRSTVETVTLPDHVIGLADDAPPRTVDTRSTEYRPAPGKDHRPRPSLAEREQHLHIPDKPLPRSRFGDSPRRRTFKGDGS
jgi:hypothetical protein